MPLPQPLPFIRRAVLAAVVAVGGPVSAQTISVTPEPPAARDGAAASQWERLSLREAVQTGVAQNLDLMTERLRLDRQRRLERGVWAGYSPTVVLDADLVRLRSALDPQGRRTVHTHSAGIVWRTPVGTTLSAEGVMVRGLAGDGTAHQGGLVFGVSQPLLRGGWMTGAALPLREADLQSALQRESFRFALNALMVDVETAYWDLALAAADVEIKQRSLERAVSQFEDTQENIRRGILAPSEIYVVEENVVFFRQEVVQSAENHARARRRLAELLQLHSDESIAVTDPLEGPELELPLEAQVLSVGMDLHPLIVAQRHRLALSEVRQRYAKNQSLPSLDLTGSLSLLGQDPRYGGALGAAVSDSSPEARVGLRFALPLDRGAERALVDGAILDSERERVEVANTERQVTFEIVNGLSELRTNVALLSLTEKQVELAELKLAAETEKYQSGLSTLVDVVRFQRDVDNAQIRLQRVRRQVRVGRVRLLAAQGDLHLRRGVEVP